MTSFAPAHNIKDRRHNSRHHGLPLGRRTPRLRAPQIETLARPPQFGPAFNLGGSSRPSPVRSARVVRNDRPKRIVIPGDLAAERARDPVDVLNAFLEHRTVSPASAAGDLRLPGLARTIEQTRRSPRARAISVDRIALGPPMLPGHCDRSRVDDVALDLVGEQQAMNPKPVQSRFLNDDRLDPHAVAQLGLRP